MDVHIKRNVNAIWDYSAISVHSTRVASYFINTQLHYYLNVHSVRKQNGFVTIASHKCVQFIHVGDIESLGSELTFILTIIVHFRQQQPILSCLFLQCKLKQSRLFWIDCKWRQLKYGICILNSNWCVSTRDQNGLQRIKSESSKVQSFSSD